MAVLAGVCGEGTKPLGGHRCAGEGPGDAVGGIRDFKAIAVRRGAVETPIRADVKAAIGEAVEAHLRVAKGGPATFQVDRPGLGRPTARFNLPDDLSQDFIVGADAVQLVLVPLHHRDGVWLPRQAALTQLAPRSHRRRDRTGYGFLCPTPDAPLGPGPSRRPRPRPVTGANRTGARQTLPWTSWRNDIRFWISGQQICQTRCPTCQDAVDLSRARPPVPACLLSCWSGGYWRRRSSIALGRTRGLIHRAYSSRISSTRTLPPLAARLLALQCERRLSGRIWREEVL